MIYIRKGTEPGSFIRYRHQKNASFDDMDAKVKDDLRQSLLEEQGYLCAYCMCRIHDSSDVKIEHFVARTPQNELQYSNLLAVCKGGENGPKDARSCDTKKGNRPIFINPTAAADMSRIYYSNNGEVHSSDTTEYEYCYSEGDKIHRGITCPNEDLSSALNLNYENGVPLMMRKAALKQFQKKLMPYKKKEKAFLLKMQEKYMESQAELEPYVGILRWYIAKKLHQLEKNNEAQ